MDVCLLFHEIIKNNVNVTLVDSSEGGYEDNLA